MDIRQLTTFREVILTGSVTEAAQKLGRTQPAVSHLLAKLEDELGMPLFERRNGRLIPVPEADYLFRQADRILRDLRNIETTMHRMRDVEAGMLRIVSMPGPAIEFLPSLISEHLGPRPEVTTTLLSRSSEAVHRLIEAQQFDIGIADHIKSQAASPAAHHRTFRFRRLCAVAADHPLAGQEVVRLSDLSGEPLAALFQEHATTRELSQLFDQMGLQFKLRFEGQFFLHLLTFVRDARACALVDPIAVESWRRMQRDADKIVFLPVEPRLAFDIDLITPMAQTRSRVARFFEARLVEALSDIELQNNTHDAGL